MGSRETIGVNRTETSHLVEFWEDFYFLIAWTTKDEGGISEAVHSVHIDEELQVDPYMIDMYTC